MKKIFLIIFLASVLYPQEKGARIGILETPQSTLPSSLRNMAESSEHGHASEKEVPAPEIKKIEEGAEKTGKKGQAQES